MQTILDGLAPKIAELRDMIAEYESDTFSASSSEVTEEEIDTIAEILISNAIQKMIDTETLDGVRLSAELEEIREDA